MSPPTESDLPICAICGNPIPEEEIFTVGIAGQPYHWACVRKRQAEGRPPELAEDAPPEP